MRIHLLDEHLINQIAAGEVIERPASVVKELVDNALDSGATRITVRFLQGGMDEIEVEDNGHGIEEEDLPFAFLRHATSKIASEQDLYRITTMGFRGEALPSIASVSQLDIFTCTPNHQGIHGFYEGGRLQFLQAASCPPGTRIVVRNLFYNTPARRKFLKSTVSEGNQIHDLICRYALARPEVSFSLSTGRKEYFKTPGNGSMADAATAIYGLDYVSSLLEVHYQGTALQLTGLISPPEKTRSNRRSQYFFVNQRPVRSSLLYKSIDLAYKGLLISKEHPLIFLSLLLPTPQVDVNVHPQKWEVRFADEQQVLNLVRQVLAERLAGHSHAALPGVTNTGPIYLSAGSDRPGIKESRSIWSEESWVPEQRFKEPPSAPISQPGPPTPQTVEQQGIRILGQLLQAYIVMEKEDGVWIVDQHAAHERIIYNEIRQQYGQGVPGTPLLIPVSVELSPRQVDILENERVRLLELGFDIDRAGPGTVLLRAAPAQIKGREGDIIMDLVDLLEQGETHHFLEEVMIRMACRRAVKAGDYLDSKEMHSLIRDLLKQEDYRHCPHGRPTLVTMNRSDLERSFKRS